MCLIYTFLFIHTTVSCLIKIAIFLFFYQLLHNKSKIKTTYGFRVNVHVCISLYLYLYSVLCSLCICVYASTAVSAGVRICVCVNLPLTRWQVRCCVMPWRPMGLLSMHKLSTLVLRQYSTMLCSAPVLYFHADKDVLSSSWAKDLLCFHDSETKIVKLPPTLNRGSL